MKRLLYILLIALPFAGCKKADITRHFTITASKKDSVLATLEIDKVQYAFTATTMQKDIAIEQYDVIDVTLSSSSSAQLTLDLTENGNYIGQAYGKGYIYMIVNNSGIYSQSANTTTSGGSSGGGSSGSSCSTVQCSASTQSGSRCKRMTTNCNGRCWQHQ